MMMNLVLEIDFSMTVRHLNLLIKEDYVVILCKNVVLIEVNFFFFLLLSRLPCSNLGRCVTC